MAGIRGKNTKPELQIRFGLHALGFRYRLHPREIPGKPDLWLPKYKAAIYVHGCFWHGHDCSLFKLPRTRQDFWHAKIDTNRARDVRVAEMLAERDIRWLSIWECAFRGPGRIGLEETLAQTATWLRSEESWGEIRGRL
ncbi:very short patch repair endonuclease [Mesorhizobium sp. UC74_2]